MEIAPMTKRDKILLYVVSMFAFIVLFVRFLLIPGIGSLQQARADLTEAQDAQITMQETILQAGVNAADKNTAWGELQTATTAMPGTTARRSLLRLSVLAAPAAFCQRR